MTANSETLAAAWEHINRQIEAIEAELASMADDDNRQQAYAQHLEQWRAMTPEALIEQTQQTQMKRRRYRAVDLRRERRHRQERLGRLIEDRGIRYANCTLANFEVETEPQHKAMAMVREYDANMLANIEDGRGLLLVGSCGTGKDHLLMALARRAILHRGVYSICVVSGASLERTFRGQIQEHNMDAKERFRNWLSCDVLWLSDPAPAGLASAYQQTCLHELIDTRYNRRLANWVSVNATGRQQMEATLGARIVDRLRDRAVVVQMVWPSYRRAGR